MPATLLTSDDVADALRARPGSTARELRRYLRSRGHEVRRRDVNGVLYRHRDGLFVSDGDDRPRWVLADGSASRRSPSRGAGYAAVAGTLPLDVAVIPAQAPPRPTPSGPVPLPERFGDLALRDWQVEALQGWYGAGCTGVVEAVTGTGKTHVGLAALADTVQRGERAVVLVPGIELQEQWATRIAENLTGVRVALLGGGHVPGTTWDVVVAVINTASAEHAARRLAGAELVVADECHRYGAESFARALRGQHGRRLGLTATYERNDNGIEEYLEPYFGDVVFEYDYYRAVPEGVVAPFVVALVGVPFDEDERAQYEELTDEITQIGAKLRPECRDDKPFLQEVSRLAASYDRVGMLAKKYLGLVSRRLALLSACQGKQEVLPRLTPLMVDGGSLVFTDRKASAEEAARQCRAAGVRAGALHADVKPKARKDLLAEFQAGRIEVLCAPRVLDEGIDVPEADLGVVLAATRTRRQMVQRMGRVLRRKADGGHARFVLVYVEGTLEDPAEGAHADFLDMVLDVAARHRSFDSDADPEEIREFLSAPVVDGAEPVVVPAQREELEANPERDRVRALEQEVASLLTRLEQAERLAANMSATVGGVIDERDAAETKVEELQEELCLTQDHLVDLEAALATRPAPRDAAAAGLERELTSARAELKRSETAAARSKGELATSLASLTEAKEQLMQEQNISAELLELTDAAERRATDAVTASEALAAQVAALQAAPPDTAARDALAAQIAELQQARQDDAARMSALEAELRRREQELDRRATELMEQQQELEVQPSPPTPVFEAVPDVVPRRPQQPTASARELLDGLVRELHAGVAVSPLSPGVPREPGLEALAEPGSVLVREDVQPPVAEVLPAAQPQPQPKPEPQPAVVRTAVTVLPSSTSRRRWGR